MKDKKRDRRVRDGDPSWGGSREGEVSKHQKTLSLAGLWGVLESQLPLLKIFTNLSASSDFRFSKFDSILSPAF